ncbi:MAG: DUF3488 and DUF4129 domain-containing transglutaminase family protein [Streptosporangiaceae bacterium]
MNHRLTVTTAVSVVLCSISLFAVISGGRWFYVGIGAAITAAVAGTLTRLAPVPAAAASSVFALLVTLPLLASGRAAGVIGGVVIIAIAASSATGLRPLRALATVITYLAALLWFLNLILARGLSRAAIVPTTASLHHLIVLAGQGLAQRNYTPPVGDVAGVVLLAGGGIGLIAALADLIAVRLRSPAVAGLPLLVLFSVPVTTTAKDAGFSEALAFCLGITGFLAMLAADGRERLRIWGRLVTVWQGSEEPGRSPDTRALSTSGRRIGLAAISVAVVAPLLLPGIRIHELFHHVSAGPGPGGTGRAPGWTPSELPQPLAQMQGQLLGLTPKPVLTYRTADPDAADHYLQVFVLNYDGTDGKWELVPPGRRSVAVSSRQPLQSAPGLAAGLGTQAVPMQITMDQVSGSGYGGKTGFLPVPYAPLRLQVAGSWQEDDATLMIYSQHSSLAGLRYSVTSQEPDPTPQQLDSGAAALPPTGEQDYLGFASPDQAALRALAQHIVSGAKPETPYQKALALQNWFLQPGRFTYTLSPDLPNTQAGLLDFLTKDRRGYCQQFAFAMAALARLLGIPSRIAVGYTGGIQQQNGSWAVTTDDAHAWPELYFGSVGWLRFEPTPGGSAGQGTATAPVYAATAGSGSSIVPPVTGSAGAKSTSRRGETAVVHDRFRGSGTPGGVDTAVPVAGHPGTGAAAPLALGLAILALLAAIGPRTARTAISRDRWRRADGDAAAADAAWRELRDDLADFGVGVRPSESPRAVARRIAASESLPPAADEALRRVASAVERARYAAEPGAAQTLRADVAAVHKALSQRATRRDRWRARLMPASTLGLVEPALRHSFEFFSWLEISRGQLRRPRKA